MNAATRQIEITVRSINQPASLGKLMAVTVSCGAEVLAACSYWDGSNAVMKLVTEDAPRTMRALQAAGFDCRSNSVVVVETPDKPGLAALLHAKLVAAGIHVFYHYSLHGERHQSHVVFKTSDDDRAIYLLEVDALIHNLAAAKSWRQSPEADVVEFRMEKHAA
ncbi:MAG TPA: hypothetical protein VLZ30_10240 [Verrucomicrobiae bacterium]|nr:hypothetical protein [Verrucomicrobiae bacterium]